MQNPTTHCCCWVAGWLCGFVPALADFIEVHPCSLDWLGTSWLSMPSPRKAHFSSTSYSRQAIPGFYTWKGSKQEHMRPLRPRIRRYIIPWMPFYWPKHSHKAGPDSKGEGKDSTHWWGELQDHMVNGIHTESDRKLETSLQSICHKYPGILQIIYVAHFPPRVYLPHISTLLVKTFEFPLCSFQKKWRKVPLDFKMAYKIFNLPK